MIRNKPLLLLFFTGMAFLQWHCGRSADTALIPSVYAWRSSFTYEDSTELGFLQKHHIKRVYVKTLDVDWNEANHAYPVSVTNIRCYGLVPDSIDYVPVVYITNRTMLRIDSSEMDLLARRILRFSLGPMRKRLNYEPRELQVDCDWSEKSREKYFLFLQKLRQQMPAALKLSVTLRLHQLANPLSTGIPPADRAMLMLYNISNARELREQNSIFNKTDARRYLRKAPAYPLPIDLALPVFSWAIVFRQGHFRQIMNDVNRPFADSCHFLQKENDYLYQVTADTVFRNIYLRKGDQLKVEDIEASELEDMLEMAAGVFTTDTAYLSLFDLDAFELQQYSDESIEKVYHHFH